MITGCSVNRGRRPRRRVKSLRRGGRGRLGGSLPFRCRRRPRCGAGRRGCTRSRRDAGPSQPQWFQVYLGLEAEAALIREYAAELVPGLLQTAEYARAFLHAPPAAASEEEITRRITVRLARQERLTGEDPPEYWAVLNEAVIHRAVGGAEAMRAQLDHIAALAELPHVNVQVLPFTAGVHPAMEGAFSTLGFPEPADPDVVYMENQAGSLYLEEAAEIDRYTRMFSYLIAKALDPEESRRMITRVARDLTG